MPVFKTSSLPPLALSFDETRSTGTSAEIVFRFGAAEAGRVTIQSDGATLRRSGDVLLCLGLAPALELGADLVIDGPVDATLLANASSIQSLLCSWYRGFRRIDVLAETGQSSYPDGRGAGVFYSGGLDSSFSLVTERERLDTLVTVVGADVDPADQAGTARLRDTSRAVAGAYGLKPILITTDARKLTDRLVGWSQYHGAFLAAVRHLLADSLHTQLVASSGTDRPWGSHMLLDAHYGTTGAAIEHHGHLPRIEKIRRIIDEPAIMAALHVCSRTDTNCGKCAKCAFVICALAGLDAFDRSSTFDGGMLSDARPRVANPASRDQHAALRALLADRQADGDLIARIDRAIAAYERGEPFDNMFPRAEWRRQFKRRKRRRRYMAVAQRA